MKFVVSLSVLSLCVLVGYAMADDSVEQAVADANNQFTVDFFKKISDGKDNVVSSPFSVSTVLSMLLVGARGDTATEMKRVLDYDQLSQDQINSGYKKIIPALAGNSTVELTDAIFVNKNFKVQQDFQKTLKSVYQSGEYALDVANGQKQINDFVSEHTHGKIPQVIGDPLPNDTEIVLVNVIYFKGTWERTFDQSQSRKEPFTNEDGSTTTTTLMHLTSNFKYVDNKPLGSQVILLPYKGGAMYMVFVLPHKSQSLSTTESLLNSSMLIDAIKQAKDTEVIVTIPKYKIESSFDLNQPLMDSGMKLAFLNSADFSGVSNQTAIHVTSVVQTAMIEVNEEGTEAAAATGVTGSATGGIEVKLEFRANRPFLYAIYHQPTNSILFIGRYVTAKS